MDLERLLKLYRASYDVTYSDIAATLGMGTGALAARRRGTQQFSVREFMLLHEMLLGLDQELTERELFAALPGINRTGTWAEGERPAKGSKVKATYRRGEGGRFQRI